MPSVLVTGANRGIGLEFVRQYAAEGWRVHACARNPDAPDLKAVAGDVVRHPLDVTVAGAPKRLAAQIDEPLDVLVLNAGLGAKPVGAFGAVDYAAWDEAFAVNVRGAVACAEAFAPHVERARGRIAAISSLMGSITDASSGALCYRATKAALNMAMKMIAAELAPRGVAVAPFHPGWVRTDMGGPNAPVSPEDSVAGLRARISEMPATASPRFLDYAGRELPW